MMSESPGSVMERVQTEVLSTRGSQLVVVTNVVMNTSLGKHSIVFDLRFTERGRVTGEDDQLALPGPKSLQSLLVSQAVLSRLHNQSKSGIDRFIRLLTPH